MVLEDGTQGLMVVRQVLYHLNPSASPFFIGYFWDRALLYAHAGLDHILLFVLP
jgi:hypothetical protein